MVNPAFSFGTGSRFLSFSGSPKGNMVRKPRQLYTDQESTKLDAAAQQTFEQMAGGGLFLPWELCREMVELKFWQDEAEELLAEVNTLIGK